MSYAKILDRFVVQMDCNRGYKEKGRFVYRCVYDNGKVLGACMITSQRNHTLRRYGATIGVIDMSGVMFLGLLDGTAKYNARLMGRERLRNPARAEIEKVIRDNYDKVSTNSDGTILLKRKPLIRESREVTNSKSLGERLISKYN